MRSFKEVTMVPSSALKRDGFSQDRKNVNGATQSLKFYSDYEKLQ
jgi:hypothetical protein